MINEGKKITAFDLLEAAMALSDVYHKNNANRSVTVLFNGNCESLYIDIYEWDIKRTKITKILESATIYLDVNYGDTFEKAFDIINKEMEQYE